MTMRAATEPDAGVVLQRTVVHASPGRLTFGVNRWAMGGDGDSEHGRP